MQEIVLFITFFKIGLFTIGGGYAMIPLIQDEVVANNWLTPEQLLNFIGISESTPGPFAINIATFVGMNTAGFVGALCATLGVVLPSVVIIICIAKWFTTFADNPSTMYALNGIKPCVIGLMFAASFNIMSSTFVLQSGINLKAVVIFGIIFVLSFIKKLSPIALIGLSALLGVIIKL